jgi:hypothetical protein
VIKKSRQWFGSNERVAAATPQAFAALIVPQPNLTLTSAARRALATLTSFPEGSTEGLLFACGFKLKLISGLLNAGLATKGVMVGEHPRIMITDAGRVALELAVIRSSPSRRRTKRRAAGKSVRQTDGAAPGLIPIVWGTDDERKATGRLQRMHRRTVSGTGSIASQSSSNRRRNSRRNGPQSRGARATARPDQ